MDRLPTEILNRIFCRLHFSQRVRCTLVCRRWATHIHSFNLLDDLTIEDSGRPTFFKEDDPSEISPRSSFEVWKKRITKEPRWGKQVRQLLLINCLKKKDDLVVLPTLFPFLRSLFLHQFTESVPDFEAIQSADFEPWVNRLEKLMEASSHMFTYTILGAGIFDRLESLSITYNDNMSVSSSELFERFKHVPHLKNLELNQFDLNFPLLEILHNHTPNLISFKMKESVFSSADFFPTGVEPLPSLTSFRLCSCDFSVIRLEFWRKYFTIKYPNVTDLTFDAGDITTTQTPGENQTHTLVLKPILQQLGHQLTTFRVDIYRFNPEWLTILEKERAKLHTLYMSAFFNPQVVYDLVPFTLFQNLSTLFINIARTVEFSWLESLKQLKVLKMDYIQQENEETPYSVCLNQLLFFASATLEKLVLTRAHVTIATPSLMTNSNLKSLKLKQGDVDEFVIAYLSQHCPQLRTLSLVGNASYLPVIHLPNHHLAYFEVTTPDNKTNIKVTYNGGTCIFVPYHRFTKVKRSMMKDTVNLTIFSMLKSTSGTIVDKDDESKKTVHLMCQSLQNLFVNEYCAY